MCNQTWLCDTEPDEHDRLRGEKKVIFPDNEALSRLQAWLHLFWDTHCPCSLQKRAATLILKVLNDETLSILDLTAGANITIFLEENIFQIIPSCPLTGLKSD